jgi:hypothetical protein
MNRGQRRARWLAQHRNAMQGTSGPPRSLMNAHAVPSTGRVHIEELVLHGFPTASAQAIGEATRQEMTRELRVRGLPTQMIRDATHVKANSFQLPPGAQPKAIGALVAKAVYGGSKR